MRPPREDISIGPVTTSLRKTAVEEGWFDNEEDNRNLGWGSGEVGKTAGREAFISFLNDDVNAAFVMGIYEAGVPAGFLVVRQFEPAFKTAVIHPYVSRSHRKFNVFRTAMLRAMALMFESGIYRIEACPLSYNKPAVSAFLSLGFRREGYKRAALWVDGNPMTQVLMRMLRKDFREMYKGVI